MLAMASTTRTAMATGPLLVTISTIALGPPVAGAAGGVESD